MSSKVNCKNNVIQKYKVIYLYVSKVFINQVLTQLSKKYPFILLGYS